MIRDLLHFAKRDPAYWQFPLALSIITVGSLFLSAWLYEVTVPLWLLVALAVLFVGISTLTAWWLLLGKRSTR